MTTKNLLTHKGFDFIVLYESHTPIYSICKKLGSHNSNHYYNLVRKFKQHGILDRKRHFTELGKEIRDKIIELDKILKLNGRKI